MTFDSNISNEISLSKVLDVFIIEHEAPSTIIAFLLQHDNDFKDILKYSFYCDRIFQIDFFLKCSIDEQEYLMTKLKHVNINDAAMLTWQLMKSRAKESQNVKRHLRNELEWILKHGPQHPYHSGHHRYVSHIDELCFKLCETDRFLDLSQILNTVELYNYFKHISYSLFQGRVLQYDFMSTLNDADKYVFITTVFRVCSDEFVYRLALQILDSDESIEVKKLVVNSLNARFFPHSVLDQQTRNLIDQCTSFSEIMLKMTIFNFDVSQFIVLYLLLTRPEFIREWAEYDESELNRYLNISHLALHFSTNHRHNG